MNRPFSYAERLQKDLREQRPDILAQSQPMTCRESGGFNLHFADPNSALGDYCVHAWDEQIDIHWGWDLQHMHYLGSVESDVEMFVGLYEQALEELIATWTGEMVFLFCSNRNSTYGLLHELEELVEELKNPSALSVHDGDVDDLPTENLEYVPITWTRPYDEIAKTDIERLRQWLDWRAVEQFCKRPF